MQFDYSKFDFFAFVALKYSIIIYNVLIITIKPSVVPVVLLVSSKAQSTFAIPFVI